MGFNRGRDTDIEKIIDIKKNFDTAKLRIQRCKILNNVDINMQNKLKTFARTQTIDINI